MPERTTTVLPAEEIRKLAAESRGPEPALHITPTLVELALMAAAVVMAVVIF